MTLIQYIQASICAICLIVGQLLFKVAAEQTDSTGATLPIYKVLFSVPLISACIIYALTILLYVYLLQTLPLSRLYLFIIGASAFVPILAILIFKEEFNIRYIIGAIIVFIGVAVATAS